MNEEQPRLLRLAEVQKIVGLQHSEVYRRMGENRFPRPLKLGPKCVRWVAHEVKQWVDSLPRTGEVVE